MGSGWGRGSKRGVKVLYHDQAGELIHGSLSTIRETKKMGEGARTGSALGVRGRPYWGG